MPLTHVCMWEEKIGYRSISLEEASEQFSSYTVTANSGFFRCELCGQPVGLSKPRVDTGNRYFFHSSGEQDKSCEDRMQDYDRPLPSLSSHTMPLRIKQTSGSYDLQIGFFLPPESSPVRPQCTGILIRDEARQMHTYRFERLAPAEVTYLSVGPQPSGQYALEYTEANDALSQFWPRSTDGVSPGGTCFDANSGRMVLPGGKVYPERDYLLLKQGTVYNNCAGIEVREEARYRSGSFETWRLYRVRAFTLSQTTASFFMQYSLFLTENPVAFQPIWPVTVRTPYFICHRGTSLYFHLQGKGVTLKSFPIKRGYQEPKALSTARGSLVKIIAPERSQLLSLGRGDALGFTYLLSQPLDMQAPLPMPEVRDETGRVLDQDEYRTPPRNRTAVVKPPYDGSAELYRSGKLQYIYPLRGGQVTSVDSIATGSELRLYQGCDIVRTIRFGPPPDTGPADGAETDRALLARLTACAGDLTDLPHGSAALAAQLGPYPGVRSWYSRRVRAGRISRRAYRILTAFCRDQREKKERGERMEHGTAALSH